MRRIGGEERRERRGKDWTEILGLAGWEGPPVNVPLE